jgi:hypothetical protein
MISFRDFCEHSALGESVVRKGAVAAFALHGKRHGDDAVRHFKDAKAALHKGAAQAGSKQSDHELVALSSAINFAIDGLISMRQQIGSVSAQITSQSAL